MALFSIVLLVQLVGLVLGVATAIDASRYPEWAFAATGTTRLLWILLPILFIVFCGIGAIVMGGMWFTAKKAQVAAAAAQTPPPSPPGQGWQPPQ